MNQRFWVEKGSMRLFHCHKSSSFKLDDSIH